MLVWLLQRSEPTPHDNSGEQRSFRTGIMAEIFSGFGHKVVWWTSTFDHYNRCQRYNHNCREQVTENYSVQYLKGCGYKRNVSLARINENVQIARKFATIAKQENFLPDIIVASMPTAELAYEAIRFAKPHGIPVVLDVRDLWPDFIYESVPTLLKPLARIGLSSLIRKTHWVFSNADAIISITDDLLDWGVSYADRKREQHDCVFPMGYIKRKLSNKEKKIGNVFWESHNVGDNDGVLNVIFVGTLSSSFNLSEVVEAARLLEDRCIPVRFVICGKGIQSSSLKKKCASLNNVIMPGWINDIQIRTLLDRADIGLAPYIDSPSYIKSVPNKPAEYLSAGLSVATSLATGPLVKLIGKYQCGFQYMNNSEILAEKLTEYTNANDTMLKKTKKNALQVYESFLNGEKIYLDMISYLEKIVNTNKNVKFTTSYSSN